ncbi:(2Fe-2S)-binding protein [Streptomyces sp. VRA16 Mangrove soil]|uniref:(2Fe-2S)-binding protein n=1 Tax=Streptomyces sp. VRA16 Mangrove soil TaxID=2817434 RepID=UPI001A9DA2B8|nr:(2Fe-2S)-binding protein [Streptomyces sp. VRA16 Mangrove soil]MBO1330277.1 (2Fe-2S)-binding protein [Streptomyces sp. VRA16 Mangrove soil]
MSEQTEPAAAAVLDALRDVARLGGFFALPVAPDGTGRGSAESFTEGFAERAREVNRRFGTDEARVGVSIVHLGLAARLWSPLLACAVLHGIVPVLSHPEWVDGSSEIRLRTPPTGRDVRQLPHLADALLEQVTVPLAAVERALDVKIAPRLLDGNVASALVGSAAVLQRARPDTRPVLTPLIGQLLATGRLVGTGTVTGPGPTFRRRSCCLLYRASAGSLCGDCCLARP